MAPLSPYSPPPQTGVIVLPTSTSQPYGVARDLSDRVAGVITVVGEAKTEFQRLGNSRGSLAGGGTGGNCHIRDRSRGASRAGREFCQRRQWRRADRRNLRSQLLPQHELVHLFQHHRNGRSGIGGASDKMPAPWI